MAITSSDVRDAAARISSSPVSSSRKGGMLARDSKWADMRRKVARALVSDPDVLLYMAYLSSNKTAAQAAKVAALLVEIIPLVEGWKYESVTPQMSSSLSKQYSRLSSRAYLAPDELADLQASISKYADEELARAATSKGRLQVKGAEARAKYGTKKQELLAAWEALKFRLELLAFGPALDSASLQEEALALPLENLGKTLDVEDSGENSEEKLLQVLAASAALQVLGREVDHRYRMKLSSSEQFPEGVSVAASYAGGVLDQLEFSPSPALLGIKSGDRVKWGTDSAIIYAVGEGSVSVRSSTISTETGTLTVYPPAYADLQALLEAVSSRDSELPTASSLEATLVRREEGSVAHIKKLVEYLVELLALLDTVPAAVTSVTTRLGVDYSQPVQTVREMLAAYAPSFGTKTTRAGDQLLDDLETAGFDYAAELLMRGNAQALMDLDVDEASKLGQTVRAASTLSAYTSGA